MGSFSIWHWLIVLLVVVLIFGTKKLKNMGSDLGAAVKGFKDGVKDGTAGAPTTPQPPSQQVTNAKRGRRQHRRRRGQDQVLTPSGPHARPHDTMLDFGFDKIALIGAVALIVIGPEKLPRVARTVGALLGKAQRYVADVKAEVNRSIELEELQKMKKQFETAASDIQSSVQQRGRPGQPGLRVELERRHCGSDRVRRDADDAGGAAGAAAARPTSGPTRSGASSAAPRRSGTSNARASAARRCRARRGWRASGRRGRGDVMAAESEGRTRRHRSAIRLAPGGAARPADPRAARGGRGVRRAVRLARTRRPVRHAGRADDGQPAARHQADRHQRVLAVPGAAEDHADGARS